MDYKALFKKIMPDALAIIFFVALASLYFFKPVSKGWILTGEDHSGAIGSGTEMQDYRDRHNGERTRWTNTLFSGMPTYQMAPSYGSTEILERVEAVYKLGLPNYIVLVYIMLLGFYILLRAFDFKAWMAALGAVLWAFSSYYFIIIAAGHIWKFYTLAFIPPTIAGMVLCYKGKYLWGLLVSAFFMALQILSNHVQMSYYFMFVIGLMALAWLFEAFSMRRFMHWFKATLAFAGGCLIGVLLNVSNLYHTYEYSKESMRGKSELTHITKDPSDQTSSGLERSYITAWSYGIGETWSLLVPNVKGGASVPLSQSETAMKKADPVYAPIYQSLGQYWGEQPGTSGPVYVGAFVLFLFILALFIVKGSMKWALFIATVLSIALSWGKNFMGFTNFFLDNVPMYDKFRTVASILVIAEFTIPLLAMLGLKKVIEIPAFLSQTTSFTCCKRTVNVSNWKILWTSFGLTGGFCLLFYVLPDVFFGNYISTGELSMLQNATNQGYIPQDMLAGLLANLNEMRRAVFQADALRSLMIIIVGVAVLLAYHYQKIKTWGVLFFLTILCTLDLWGINKRYLNDSMFQTPTKAEQRFVKTPTDEYILQDSDKYYRVANLAVNTFNDNSTGYWHKSIGGYHAAKLRRYQELIEAHISTELVEVHQAATTTAGQLEQVNGDSLFPVLNMLNMKYAILPLQNHSTAPVKNPWNNGNAWFVKTLLHVNNADEELAMTGDVNTKYIAVVDVNNFPDAKNLKGGEGTLTLTAYEANELDFEATSTTGGVAVFSDIYYPGWTCTIDGEDAEIFRADYVLRAVNLPAGTHKLHFAFHPQTLKNTETIASISFVFLVLLFVGLLGKEVWTRRKASRLG